MGVSDLRGGLDLSFSDRDPYKVFVCALEVSLSYEYEDSLGMTDGAI